jgi:drug/metabolite transporter (DMT)-like permease
MGILYSFRGEIAALIVSVAWTVTSLVFSEATKQVGTIAVNFIKLFIGIFFLSIFCYFERGLILPTDAGLHQWFWLSISGLVGFILCDLFLFKSFNLIGVRLSMLIMTLAPPLTTIGGWIFLNEKLSGIKITAVLITITGIAIGVLSQPNQEEEKYAFNITGLIFAFIGAIGQAVGYILSKIGMREYDPIASTQIRIIAAIAGFMILLFVIKRYGDSWRALKNGPAMKKILIGSIFGPVIGVGLSLFAIQNAKAGIASTLMALVPIFIIFPSVYLYKQPITKGEIVGTVISIGGVVLLFM